MSSDLAALVDPVLAVATKAGERILKIYETEFEIHEKDDETPVTAADLAANATIVEGLRDLTPEVPIVSEEDHQVPFETRANWNRCWLVDPLDGTREFIKQSGEFTVNVALIEDQRPVFGLIYVPVSGTVYFAWRNGGAFKRLGRDEAELQRIYTRPLGDDPVRVAGSRSYAVKSLQTFLRRLDNYEYVGIGAALKTCLIAEGRIDVYPRLGPTSEWDTAASQCILEEAGGQITDLHMRPLRYNTRQTLQNPPFIAFGDDRRDWSRYIPERFLEESD
jgi:3'(2'), 5'-bisphosphate nucleotidase